MFREQSFMEVLLLTWTTAEIIFGVDPWQEYDEHYNDQANLKQQEQDDMMKVRGCRLATVAVRG